jgi:hypothetical protein
MDLNSNAYRIVQCLTAENKDDKRSRAASSAGKKGGPARAAIRTEALQPCGLHRL